MEINGSNITFTKYKTDSNGNRVLSSTTDTITVGAYTQRIAALICESSEFGGAMKPDGNNSDAQIAIWAYWNNWLNKMEKVSPGIVSKYRNREKLWRSSC